MSVVVVIKEPNELRNVNERAQGDEFCETPEVLAQTRKSAVLCRTRGDMSLAGGKTF